MQAMQHNLYQLKGALRTETTNGIPLCRRKLHMSHNGVEIISKEEATYRTRAIITRGLCIINPLFGGKKCFFNFQKILPLSHVWLVFKSGL